MNNFGDASARLSKEMCRLRSQKSPTTTQKSYIKKVPERLK